MRPVLTIDLDAVAANWRALDALNGAETAAVVKADAYGLGVAEVAPVLRRAGARTFFVATAVEAMALRAALGPEPAIYVLNGPTEGMTEIVAADARPVVSALSDLEVVEAFEPVGRLTVALQFETGMNRLGLTVAEQDVALARLQGEGAPRVGLLMSHFASADAPDDPMNGRQALRFREAAERCAAAFPEARWSLSATGGLVGDRAWDFDLVRPGVGLYGGAPFRDARPVIRLDAPILRVWDVSTGERSGYGGGWTAARPSRLATIPVGYADGVPRSLSGVGEARVGEAIVPFAGRVSMDLIVLDVTDAPDVRAGDLVTLFDDTLTIDRVATTAGTIGYELLTSLGGRYLRRYKAIG